MELLSLKKRRGGHNYKCLIGKKYDRLTVINEIRDISGKIKRVCKCDCGKIIEIDGNYLTTGHTRSCGCILHDVMVKINTTHGLTKVNPRLYRIWTGMITRCRNDPFYSKFDIDSTWEKDYECFYNWAMSNGYKNNLSLDRIDNSKGYNPENCRWATRLEQNRNKTNNRKLTFNGKTLLMSEWCSVIGIKPSTLSLRLSRGMPIERALTQPIKKITLWENNK